MFEGEYLNGKRHRIGKEYNNKGILIYEGEYLYDDKLKGKFYVKERLEYEGEFLFNKKWEGKVYDEKGNIIYELKNGNGKVKEYYDNGSLQFDGEYLNGRKNGNCKEYNQNSDLFFEGEFLDGKKNGKGKEYSLKGNLEFEGEFLNGKRDKEKNIIMKEN